jgi:hypothetical protein
VEETYVPFALVVVKQHAGVTTGIQLYAEGFQPSAYRDMPSAYSTPTAALGVLYADGSPRRSSSV